MTSLTLELPDELVRKAEQIGVFDKKRLSEILHQYLQEQIEHEKTTVRGLGFLKKQPFHIPDDFDRMNQAEIEKLFGDQ